MPMYCSASGCGSITPSNTAEKVMFHRFPLKEPEKLQKWLLALGRENFQPSPFSRLCHKHFQSSDYFDGKSNLKKDAVPSIFKLSKISCQTSATSSKVLQTFPPPPPPVSSPALVDSVDDELLPWRHVKVEIAGLKSSPPSPLSASTSVDIQNVRLPSSCRKPDNVNVTVQTNLTSVGMDALNVQHRNKTKVLQQKIRRQEKMISTLKGKLAVLKKKNMTSKSSERTIVENFDRLPCTLFENEIRNAHRPKGGERYSEAVQKFALTLYFYSPKAYNFVRRRSYLPHPSRIRAMLSEKRCAPGLLEKVFVSLKEKEEDPAGSVNVKHEIDEMVIKKEQL